MMHTDYDTVTTLSMRNELENAKERIKRLEDENTMLKKQNRMHEEEYLMMDTILQGTDLPINVHKPIGSSMTAPVKFQYGGFKLTSFDSDIVVRESNEPNRKIHEQPHYGVMQVQHKHLQDNVRPFQEQARNHLQDHVRPFQNCARHFQDHHVKPFQNCARPIQEQASHHLQDHVTMPFVRHLQDYVRPFQEQARNHLQDHVMPFQEQARNHLQDHVRPIARPFQDHVRPIQNHSRPIRDQITPIHELNNTRDAEYENDVEKGFMNESRAIKVWVHLGHGHKMTTKDVFKLFDRHTRNNAKRTHVLKVFIPPSNKPHAHVTFDSITSAHDAINKLDRRKWEGQVLRVCMKK